MKFFCFLKVRPFLKFLGFWMKKFSQIDCCDTKSGYEREKFHTKRNKIEKKYEFPPDSSMWWYNEIPKS